MSILVCLLFGGIWLNHRYPDTGDAFAMEPKQEHSDKVLTDNTRALTKKIGNKLKEQNYDISGIGISYQGKEIYIQVNGTQEYVNSIEKNIDKLVYELAQKTIFKDYSIGVYMQIIVPSDAHNLALDGNELLSKLIMIIQEDLKIKGYKEIVNVLTEKKSKKLFIEVSTSIQNNSLTNINRGKEIERDIRESLTEVISTLMPENQTFSINVYDINREKIN